MKNDNRIYNGLLIVCLLIIWFFVIKKAFFQTEIRDVLVSNQNELVFDNNPENLVRDSITIGVLNNPFLKRKNNAVNINQEVSLIKKSKAHKTSKTFKLPFIEYYGYVSSGDLGEVTGLAKIEGKLFRINVRDTMLGIEVKKLYADSILITFNNSNRTIFRSS